MLEKEFKTSPATLEPNGLGGVQADNLTPVAYHTHDGVNSPKLNLGGVAGSDTQIQFNDGGVMGADSGLTYDTEVGGAFTVTAKDSAGESNGGAINITGGNVVGGTGGWNGGDVIIEAGDGGGTSTSGNGGGNIAIRSGSAISTHANDSNTQTGNIILQVGDPTISGGSYVEGGAIGLLAGDGRGSFGGDIDITAGDGDDTGSQSGYGGGINLTCGSGASDSGGGIIITAGDGDGSGGSGGNIQFVLGAAGTGDADAGHYSIFRQTGSGTGKNSYLKFTGGGSHNIYRSWGEVSTTNNTPTSVSARDCPTLGTANSNLFIEARVCARRTGGTAGTASDSAAYVRRALYKRVASAAPALVGSIQDDFTVEDQAGWDCSFVVSSNDVLLQVTGATDNNISWTYELTYIIR